MDDDTLPRRNLGALSEHWGRTLEIRNGKVAKNARTIDQFLHGDSRNTASSLEELGRQAERIREGIQDLPIFLQASDFRSNFAVPPTWVTAAETAFTVPEGKTTCDMIVRGSVNIDWVAVPGSPGFIWPFDPNTTVTSEWGPRPPLPFHNGIDFGLSPAVDGAPIPSSANGVVIASGFDADFGNRVIVDHGGGITTLYAHMKFTPAVGVGDIVAQGQTLGYIGTTGFSTGSHLHWETRVGSARINPRDFMATHGGSTSVAYTFACRLLIGGSVFRHFWSSRAPDTGDERYFVAGGRTFSVSPGTTVTAAVQVLTLVSGTNPAYPDTFGSLSASGVFS